MGYLTEDNHYINQYNVELNKLDLTRIEDFDYKEYMYSRYEEFLANAIFTRDVEATLLTWKNELYAISPIIQLDGMRQVGKTSTLLKFGYKNFDNVVYLNVIDFKEKIETILVDNTLPILYSLNKLCDVLNIPPYIDDANTLLIFDEIQSSVKIYNCLRRIIKGLKCKIIITGSYLGHILKNEEFFIPAGNYKKVRLYPLSFTEFLDAYIENTAGEKFYNLNHGDLYDCYNIYKVTGGFPSIITKYLKTRSVETINESFRQLIDTYKDESKPYFNNENETLIFDDIFKSVIHILTKEKKGSGNKLSEEILKLTEGSRRISVSKKELMNALTWLVYSGVVGTCDLYNNGDTNNLETTRRYYITDVGLANYLSSISNLGDSVINGFLTETYVYNELSRLCTGNTAALFKESVPCFSTYNNYELDFLQVGVDGVKYGIEVKTGNANAESSKQYLSNGSVDVLIKVQQTLGDVSDKIHTIPHYRLSNYLRQIINKPVVELPKIKLLDSFEKL